MNLVLLFDADFIGEDLVRLAGRRRDHIRQVHRAEAGDSLVVGRVGGKIGTGTVVRADGEVVEMRVVFTEEPPPPLDVTLLIALPRPKVLRRVVASATSLGVKRLFFINAWRVEKSYWGSPHLSSLEEPAILGLEQARDTVLPRIELRRLFRPFVEKELPELARGTRKLVAHPGSSHTPERVEGPVTVAIGPEGGFIQQEIDSLRQLGFELVSLGPRILRVETAVAALIARMM